MNDHRIAAVRELITNGSSIRKIAARVVIDSEHRYGKRWRHASVFRLRAITGESVKTCFAIVSEMSDQD